ncbi:SAV_2336 N-terminal domain-related protein, partial [Streptomyces sp. SL13]
MSTGADLFEQLVARLRDAGIATDAESLADALWLSERMTPPAPVPPAAAHRPYPRSAARLSAPAATPPEPPRRRLPYVNQAGGGRLEPLPLEQALRPLRHYRPRVPSRPGDLDEAATAETSARSGQITPVFQQVSRREAQLLLLMDDSPSMVVWDGMLNELRLVCEQVGAFRDVAVHYLRPRSDGEAGVAAAPSGLAPAASADRLLDPTGRTVLLLLSDCCGALWRHGAAQRLLHRFSRTGPVAVLQPLPQRMWQRTLLPAEPGMLCSTAGHGGRLEFVPRRRRHGPVAEDSVAVPVLAPTRAALGAWARAVSGSHRAGLDAAAVRVREDHPGGPPPPADPAPADPERLVADFQALSSPAAHHLAVYLSAAPLAYPVMRAVQEAMMPQTGPAEMAEILLGELLARADDRPPTVPAQRLPGGPAHPPAGRSGPWYTFAPGVRDVLLRRLGLGEASLVLKHCALYVDRVYGPRVRNVPALVLGYLSGTEPGTVLPPFDGPPASSGVPSAFAEAAHGVLRRFQPGGVTAESGRAAPGVVIAHRGRVTEGARHRLARFREHGTISDLWEAIRLLRTAPADPGRPAQSVPARTLLAECLLALWEVRRGDDLLAEAHTTARAATAVADRPSTAGQRALPPEVAGRAHLVRGQVLFAIARAQDHPITPDRALAGAAAHLNRAACLSRADPEQALAARMALVDLARARYDRTGDRAALRDARERLDAALAARPAGAPVPPAVLAARGALLAALAEDALRRNAPDRAREPARAAVADLAAAAASPFTAFPGRYARALLALAAARALATGDPGAPEVMADLRRALAAAEGRTPDQAATSPSTTAPSATAPPPTTAPSASTPPSTTAPPRTTAPPSTTAPSAAAPPRITPPSPPSAPSPSPTPASPAPS